MTNTESECSHPLKRVGFYNICDWIDFKFSKPKEYVEYNVEIRTSEEKIKALIERIESRLNRVFEKERDYLELKHERKDGSVVFFQLIASKWNVNNEDYSKSLVESVEVSKTIKRKTLKKLFKNSPPL